MNGFLVLVVVPALTILVAVRYFQKVEVERPPVGVYTLRDIIVVMAVVVVLPVLYLALPNPVVVAMLGLMTVLAVQFTLAPLLSGRAALAVAAVAGAVDLTLVLADVGSAAVLWNNLLMLTLVVGVTNLYVQSGVKARDVAVFGMLLAGYDVVATTLLPTMGDLLRKTVELPFAPVFAEGAGPTPIVIGLGDVLMLTLWTLVSLKAFGRAAAWAAGCAALVLTAGLALALQAELLPGPFPVMLVAGPLMALHYLVWRRLRGTERTTADYRGTVADTAVPSADAVARHLAAVVHDGPGSGWDGDREGTASQGG